MKVFELLKEDNETQRQKRMEFLKKTYEHSWHGLPGFKKFPEFLDAVAATDPTKNGAYMQWITKLALKNPSENKTEDFDRLKQDLQEFEANKSKLTNKDINAYKSFHDLYTAIAAVQSKPLSDEEKKEAELEQMKNKDIIDVYKGADGWIKIPKTQEAACFLGQNTRWCTAATKGSNMFHHYNKSDVLFVIYDKKTKARYQLHIDSGQFADVTDRTKPFKNIPDWATDPIVKWYQKNNPKVSLKHLLAFAELGHPEAVKGTDHEDIVELMKKHGVI
jgi:hypothetical protein